MYDGNADLDQAGSELIGTNFSPSAFFYRTAGI